MKINYSDHSEASNKKLAEELEVLRDKGYTVYLNNTSEHSLWIVLINESKGHYFYIEPGAFASLSDGYYEISTYHKEEFYNMISQYGISNSKVFGINEENLEDMLDKIYREHSLGRNYLTAEKLLNDRIVDYPPGGYQIFEAIERSYNG